MGIQDEYLSVYQKITESGANFGGSLTDMRLAASGMYVTLSEFSQIVTENRQNFLSLGGSVNGGVKAFAKFSNEILDSEVGVNLRALGYTTKDANEALLAYVSQSGMSNLKDLETNKQLRDGAVQYLGEMDRLAEVTGKSRKEQEETMKKLKLDAEVQMTAARIKDEGQRKRFLENVKYMNDMYGDAGKDIALAQQQGRSVVTKEGKTLVSLAPQIQENYAKLAKATSGSKEAIDAQNAISLSVQQGFDQLPIAVFSTNDSIKNLGTSILTAAAQEEAGLTSKEAFDKRDREVAEEKLKRENSQAKNAVEAQKAIQDMGQTILQELLPIFELFTSAIDFVLPLIRDGFNAVMPIVEKVGKVLEPLIPHVIHLATAINNGLSPVVKFLSTALNNALDPTTTLGTIVKGLVDVIGFAIDAVSFSFEKLGESLTWLGNMVSDVWDALKSLFNSIKSYIPNMPKLPSWLGDIKDRSKSVVGNIINTVSGNVKSTPEEIEKYKKSLKDYGKPAGLPDQSSSVRSKPVIDPTSGKPPTNVDDRNRENNQKPKIIFTPPTSEYRERIPMPNTVVPKKPKQDENTDNSSSESDKNTALSIIDKNLSLITAEIKLLNTKVTDMARYVRDTADYAKQNVDATKNLNPSLF